MGIIETREFGTENLIGGRIVSAIKSAGAGTLYRGQLLGRTDATGVYVPYNAGGSGGAENIRAVVANTSVLGAPGVISVFITGSELMNTGIVAANGDALTVTTAIIEAAQDSGIVIKKV
jgi:hypothetical protein